jgi:hypothetical protein
MDPFSPFTFAASVMSQILGVINKAVGAIKIAPTFVSSIQSTFANITGIFSKLKLLSFFALFVTLAKCFIMFFKLVFSSLTWIITSLTPWLFFKPWPSNVFDTGKRYDKYIEAAFLPWIIRFFIVLSTRVANFPKCFVWYIIDIATWTIYLPFRFIFWLIDSILNVGIVKGEHKVWNFLNDIDYYIHGPVRNYFLDQYVTMYNGDKMFKDGEIVPNPKGNTVGISFDNFTYKDTKNHDKIIDVDKEKDINAKNLDKTITNDSGSMNLGFHIFHFPNSVMETCYSATGFKLADLDPYPMDIFNDFMKCIVSPSWD